MLVNIKFTYFSGIHLVLVEKYLNITPMFIQSGVDKKSLWSVFEEGLAIFIE